MSPTTLLPSNCSAARFNIDDVLHAASRPNPFASLHAAAPATRFGLLDALAERHGPLGTVGGAVIRAGQASELLTIGLVARAVYGQGDHDGGRAAGHLEARCGGVASCRRWAPPSPSAARRWWLPFRHRPRPGERHRRQGSRSRHRGRRARTPRAAMSCRPASIAASAFAAGLDRHHSRRRRPAGASPRPLTPSPARSSSRPALPRQTPGGRIRHDHLEWPPGSRPGWPRPAPAEAGVASKTRRRVTAVTGPGSTAPGVGSGRATATPMWGPSTGGSSTQWSPAGGRRTERFAEAPGRLDQPPRRHRDAGGHGLIDRRGRGRRRARPVGDTPVLFVVLDGCGLAVVHRAGAAAQRSGLPARLHPLIRRRRGPRRLTGVAALPTVTEVSRASLIAGRLDRGNQEHERRQFEANAASSCERSQPAAFFHQNRLLGGRQGVAVGRGQTAHSGLKARPWSAWSSTPSTITSSGARSPTSSGSRTSTPWSPSSMPLGPTAAPL